MEIRPDRFKVVAAKTLGKIYGYVKIYLGGRKGGRERGRAQSAGVKAHKTYRAVK